MLYEQANVTHRGLQKANINLSLHCVISIAGPTFFYQLLAIYYTLSPSPTTSYILLSIILSFLKCNTPRVHKNTSNCGFSRSYSFRRRNDDMENLQLSVGMKYGLPSCPQRQQNIVLTNPKCISDFFLHANPFLCIKMHLCGWQRSQTACLWTACVPWACPRRHSLFFPLPVCFSLLLWCSGCSLWADSSTGKGTKKEHKGGYDAGCAIS